MCSGYIELIGLGKNLILGIFETKEKNVFEASVGDCFLKLIFVTFWLKIEMLGYLENLTQER